MANIGSKQDSSQRSTQTSRDSTWSTSIGDIGLSNDSAVALAAILAGQQQRQAQINADSLSDLLDAQRGAAAPFDVGKLMPFVWAAAGVAVLAILWRH